jgi:small conductance mechanosensitive channel
MEISLDLIETYAIPWLIKIVIALAVFVIGRMLARTFTAFVHRLMLRSSLDAMLIKFLDNLLYSILLIAVILAAIDGLGVNITSLLAIIGAAGLAIGLALKDSLSNFAAGVMIIIFRPFKIGDFITTSGHSGVVDEIGMFCTLMHTPDNQRIVMPNSDVIGGTIINASALTTRRIDLIFGISYNDNIGNAKAIIEDVLASDGRILIDPAPTVGVIELADSSVNLYVRPWVASADFWTVKCELLEKIKVALESGGLSIPYPQQDVHIHSSIQGTARVLTRES